MLHYAMDMEPENDCNLTESIVKDLQAVLFPISPRKSTSDSFLHNWFLKPSSTSAHSMNDDTSFDGTLKGRDSKELFAKEVDSTSQPPRWPTECQVLEERVIHLPYTPANVEPYNIPTGKEVQPKPVGEECGIVIYQYYPISAVNYFSRSSIGGSKYLLSTCPSPEDDHSLRFESRFESGNLAKAIKITNVYYELYLRTDLYTNRHMQWFYFRITNMKRINTYRFSIVNLMKDDSLYNEGMRPLMYSVKDAQMHSLGWRRCGDNITYFCNENVNPEDPDQIVFNTLTFTLDFPYDDDTVYLAHSYPYTYSDLQDYLQELGSHPMKSTYTNLRLLCKTLAGNNVYYITVTSPQTSVMMKKKAVVVTARVHPGETPASWMMKGILDFITGDSGPARELRDRFIFKIVPMLNPDGVIVGNNRCSLTGRDLNRQYRTVIRESYPSIWYTKLMIRRLLEECGVAMYCDLHAHSRKHNIFVYGCENRRNVDKRLQEQVFPLMLHKNAADKFSFENCIFRIQRNKEGTGRIVMWMMGICNSYTLEASFGGSSLGTRAESHFSTMDYEQMGKSFCQTLLDFYDDDPRKEKLRTKIVLRLLKGGSNADEPTNINLSDYSSDNGDTSSSSSDNECGRETEQYLTAPPPSPVIFAKAKAAKTKVGGHKKSKSKTVNVDRKPLQIGKTTLGLSLAKRKDRCKEYETTSSDSDSDANYEAKRKALTASRKKKKKKSKNDKKKALGDLNAKKQDDRYVTVLDILPDSELGKMQIWQGPAVSNNRSIVDTKKNVTLQLAEVQSKLMALKNKLWFGVGDADAYAPLSWTATLPHSAPPNTKTKNKVHKNKRLKADKTEKKFLRQDKCAEDVTQKKIAGNKQSHNGIKKQITVEYIPKAQPKANIMKRSKSVQEKRCNSLSPMPGTSKHVNVQIDFFRKKKDDTNIADCLKVQEVNHKENSKKKKKHRNSKKNKKATKEK